MQEKSLADRWEAEWQRKGRVLPDYGGWSVAEIPRTLEQILQKKVPAGETASYIQKRSRRKFVFVVLDGLGYHSIKRNERRLPFLSKCFREGNALPITTVFPSTTGAAVTTFHTGRLPGEHGVIEWHLYLSEIDMLVESLPFYPKLPDDVSRFERIAPSIGILYRGRTLYSRLARKGVNSLLVQPESIAESPFSRLMSKGAYREGYSDLASAMSKLHDALAGNKYSLIHFYYPGIDAAGHMFGPSSREYVDEIAKMDDFLSSLAGVAEEHDATVVVTSDHGQVDVDPATMVMLDELPGFDGRLTQSTSGLVQPYGSPRDVIIRSGTDAREFGEWLEPLLEGKGEVMLSADMINEGYFGEDISPKARERIADLWIFPSGNNTIWYQHYAEEANVFRGMHGGRSLEEMVVPLLVF